MEVHEEEVMGQETRDADVVVVGGGLAGLAAAAYLARAGRRVIVFEKADAPGGRARTRALDGFHFNLGPHAVYRGGRGIAVLRELGVTVSGGSPGQAGIYAVRAGRLHTFPVGFVSLLTTGLLGAREKVEAARLLAGLRRLDTARLQRVTLADWLGESVESPAVRELVATAVRVATYTDDAERLSAGAGLDQLRVAGAGVLYADGGWQTIVDGLRRAAEKAGARLVPHRAVASILRDPAVRGVRLEDGATVAAAAVLLAASPDEAARLVEEGGPTVVAEWPRQAIPVHAASLDVGLDRLPNRAGLVALGVDEPLYLSVHSAVARLAPEGGALVHVARYGGRRGRPAAAVRARLEDLLGSVQRGWRSAVVRERFLPELVVTNAMATAAHGGLGGRPGPVVPDVPGLYVAGDWVGRQGMLSDASLASARAAAHAILAAPRRATAAA